MNRMAEQIVQVDIVINSLNEVLDDVTVPKNVKIKIENILDMLENSDCAHSSLQRGVSNRNFRHAQKHAPHFSAGSVFDTLKENRELPIKINKALNELGEIANDVNLHAYTRAQIWNVISALEKPESV